MKKRKDINLRQALAPCGAELVSQTQHQVEPDRSCEDGVDVDRPEVEKKASPWRQSRTWVFMAAAATAATAAAAVAAAAASRTSSTKTAHEHDEQKKT